MSVFRIFSFSANNVLGCRNLLCTRNTLKLCEQQRASIAGKVLEKLGIPLPPKRPLSPYLRYLQTTRPKILQNQPNLSPNQIIKVIAQEWAKHDPEKKKLLQKEYLQEMEVYLVNLEKYKKSITPEQQDLINTTKEKQKRAKEFARIQEKKESLGKPKKPPTAFLKFMLNKKSSKDDSIKYTEWLKEIAKEWENIPETEKEKYKEETKVELVKYKSDLLVWEENMIRQGHIDVVRNKELVESRPVKRRSSQSSKSTA